MTQDFEQGFNVRAYGILVKDIPEKGPSVLLSHEFYDGPELLKYPGGGVEHLEGPGEALVREFKEEADISIELGEFHYVSPGFQKSYFRKMQLVALYWQVKAKSEALVDEEPRPIAEGRMRQQKLYWHPLSELKAEIFGNSADQEATSHLLHLAATRPFW